MRTFEGPIMPATVRILLLTVALLPPFVVTLPRAVRQALQPDEGTWGPWTTEWSVCSRTCGGGVSYQTRDCITTGNGREPNCMGSDVNYRSCNIQDCPEGAQDFREVQCSKYNSELFLGEYYTWVPYHGGENKCELNCMPRGKHFYYRLAEKVIDGTSCDADSLDICVNGECMKVGCDNLLGSDAREDVCRECNGDGSSCKTLSGVFSRKKLPFGYNDLLVLPVGAVNIRISEVKPSNNFLALHSAKGHYYINGNFSIDYPQAFYIAGTVVHYDRKSGAPFYGAEVLRAMGPITEPLYVGLITQQRNYGITYNYSVPLDNESTKTDTYSWLSGDFTACSRSCGGGYQHRDVWCVRDSDYEKVPEYLCDPTLKPALNHSCNAVSCPASWFAGEWGACSASCGYGQQVRQVYCQQVTSGNKPEAVHDSFCEADVQQSKPDYRQACQSQFCPDWKVGLWSQCSVTCGRGTQTRTVSCHSNEVLADSSCSLESRPASEETCQMGPCQDAHWLVAPWFNCSQQCGDGIQTRHVYCVGPSGFVYADGVCDNADRPDTTQRCSSRLACRPLWHASRWSECSTNCGEGLRIRNVFCAQYVNDQWETTSDSMCNATIKLPTSEVCGSGPCIGAFWLTGPWEKCSVKCGGGIRTRQIMCLEDILSSRQADCDQTTKPTEHEGCNTQPCNGQEGDCRTSEHGCCPDGITEATGPDYEGCGYSTTEAPTTVVTTATTATPSCNETSFGCCADQIQAASGPDGQGCPEEELETCEKFYEPGECYAYVIKWYFDISYQRCAKFWYGGCGGNDNRFEMEHECQSACATQQEPMTQEEMCSLPVKIGPCKKTIRSYYYNVETGQCERFNYSGCQGNRNKFSSLEECDIKCGTMNKDPCTLPQNHGNCFESQPRWFYHGHTQQCEQFNYTGCLGNPNRFNDHASCEAQCPVVDREPDLEETVGVTVDVCDMPADPGPCEDSLPYWHYNADVNTCQQFTYGGCNGNDNRFASEVECTQACASFGAEKCSLPVESGPCFGSFPAWAYNSTIGQCQSFIYGGCQGNDNRFETQEACQQECGIRAITKCRRSRTYATFVSRGSVGTFIPQCTLDGHYEAMQCHSSTGYCWCVDMDGREINGSRRAPGFHVQRPNCEAFRPRVLTICQRHLKQVLGKDGQAPPGEYVPQCTPAGEYETIQCYGSTGYCWCINEKGEEIDGTRRGPGSRPNCDGSPQGPCQTLISELADGSATSDFEPVCTPDGLFVRIQCQGARQCLCVNETTGDVLKVLNEMPQEGDFDACNDAHQELTRCQQHRNSILATEAPERNIRYVPVCTETGDYRPVQCYGNTHHCWCANDLGEEIDGTRTRPGQGEPQCDTQTCPSLRDEALLSGLMGAYVPSCNREGLYAATQCHAGTGECWCADEDGKELAETRRGPTEDKLDCEDACSLPTAVGPCRGYFPVFGYDRSTGTCDEFIYGGCQGNANRFQTQQACLEACTDFIPEPSPTPAPDTSEFTTETYDSSTTSSSIETTSGSESATTTPLPTTLSSSSTTSLESTVDSAKSTTGTSVSSTMLAATENASTTYTPTPSTPQSTQISGEGRPSAVPSMCEIQRKEALASTLPGVFIPQCQEDGSFNPKQCYELISRCWCVHTDGTEQGGTRVSINDPLDCQDICIMPEFQGQCPDNIQKWYFNAKAGICETFIYSGCQGNLNQFDDRESCEQRCATPTPTSCVDKRLIALTSGSLDVFIPQCTEDGHYMPQQCHGSIGHCWCVDERGMELGATRRGLGEELLDCEDICRLPKYSGPCKESHTMWFYDVMDRQCQQFVYGGCQGNGNRFATLEGCKNACNIPEITSRPPTTCEIQHEEALASHRLDLFIPQCTNEGAFVSRQCYDLIGQCWCVNENGEAQGGTKTRDGQVPLDCNDKCSLPKFVGSCRANIPKWFHNMETMTCEEFTYGGCGGNGNRFNSREECQQACLPQGHDVLSCNMQREEALGRNLPDAFVAQCTEDGWFAPQQCHDSTSQCWCVTESGMEQSETRREKGMPLLDCKDICSFPKATGPCLGYSAMWYYDTEETSCRKFIYGGCQGNANRFETQEECEKSCVIEATTAPMLCAVERDTALSQADTFIPQCTEQGLFARMQCHNSTGYCWCVDEITGEEMLSDGPLQPGVQPDCDAFYQNTTTLQGRTVHSTDSTTGSNRQPLGNEGCSKTTYGCCPDGLTEATRVDMFGCPGVTPPMVEVAPSDSTVSLGDTLTINCRAQGNPAPTVSWLRDDDNVQDMLDSRISVSDAGTLVIENVIEEDSGMYVCKASNGIGQAAKLAVMVDVYTPVQIPETSQHSLQAREGDIIELRCHATGNPKPVVTWEKDETVLPGDDPRMTRLEDDTLRIENVDINDAGSYSCTGRNMFGVVQMRMFTLAVEAEVHIVKLPEDTTANVGATIRLSCSSTGSPKPTTRWTVNNIGLSTMDRFEILGSGDLIIHDLRSTDAGTYTCTAANGMTSQRASATVTVTGADLDPNCQDNTDYVNCRLVLRARYCNRSPYDTYCCATCRDNARAEGRHRRRRHTRL